MATESSVVVALKEVRRLELDRQRREEESRRAVEDGQRHTSDRVSVQYGPGMQPFGNGWGPGDVSPPDGYSRPVHRTSEVMTLSPGAGPMGDFANPQSYVGQGAWESQGFAPVTAKPKSSSFKAVLITLLLCGGAAAGGLWKVKSDFDASLRSQAEGQRQRMESLRMDQVAERSKVEQELKVRVAELEGKLATASAKASTASAALALAAKTAAAGPTAAPLPAAGLRKGRGLGAGRPAAAAPAVKAAPLALPAAPKAAPAGTPKVAKKKSLSDDPLNGLRL